MSLLPAAWNLVATGNTEARSLDTQEARKALAVLADPAAGIELRALPSARFRICRGNDLDAQLAAAAELADEAIYFALNPIPANLDHRTRVNDPLRRRWLLIDLDRTKTEATKELSASNAEKEAVRLVAYQMDSHLKGLGWPSPLLIDSGNGWHLLFRVDLPNDDASHDLLHGVLKTLAAQFNTDEVDVDVKCHNASRISKLPGCWARKGPDLPDRPHRPCRLVWLPQEVQPVPVELLTALVGSSETVVDTVIPSPWIVTAVNESSSAYGRAALEREAGRVSMAPAGERNDQLFKSTASLAELVAGGVLGQQEVESAMRLAAERCGLSAKEITATLRSAFEKGSKQPRGVPDKTEGPNKTAQAAEEDDGWTLTFDDEVIADGTLADLASSNNHKSGKRVYDLLTLKAMLAREYPEPNWVVPGLLSEGLNILAGKPKQGKSMLAMNLALTVAGGGKALKQIRVAPGDVLYLSLEDKQRRVQSRARKMAQALGSDGLERITIATTWPRQDAGGLKLLEHWFKRVERPTLVVIDVWSIFRPSMSNRGSAYDQDYRHMNDVKQIMDKHSCNVLVLTHCRKGGAEDALEEVSGTMGLTGVADGVVVLSRSRNDNEAKIFVTGRDVQDQELALRFDPETLTWESLGGAEEHVQGKLQVAILAFLKSFAGATVSVKDICEHVNVENDSTVRKVLHRLREKGFVRKSGQGWAHPGETPDSDSASF